MKRKIIIPLIFIFILMVVLFLRKPEEENSIKEWRFLLGVPCEIELVGENKSLNQKLMEESFSLIMKYDELLSNYKEDSDTSVINLLASAQPVKVDLKTYDLLEKSLEYAKISEGLFDITIFPLIKAWGFFSEEMEIPAEQVIDAARSKVGWQRIQLSKQGEDAYIQFQGPHMEIDLGGIGKGFICDAVVSFLKSEGARNFLVNIGGNLYASGTSPSGEVWRIGIRDPRNQNGLTASIEIQEKAVSTSGDYERFFIKDGRRYSHIIHPKTGWPVSGMVSVTVVADEATHADAASTILFLTEPGRLDTMFHRLELEKAIIIRENDAGELDTIVMTS